METTTTTCENCNAEIVQTNKYRVKKTCSTECRYALAAKSTREKSGAWTTTTCQGCGASFQNSVAKPKKFCTRECFSKTKAEASRVDKTCVQCGREFTAFTRTGQTYCSPLCRNRHVAANREKNYPQCRACGVSTESYNRVYCAEHTVPGGAKPQPRLTAQCWGCGQEFSRPAGYAGVMHYCSNKCSHSETKSVRDKFVANLNDKAVVFHSGWEIRFWATCLRFDVPVRRYDGPDIQTSQGVYRPDFIVGPDEVVVEVKGWADRPGTREKLANSGVTMIELSQLQMLEQAEDKRVFTGLLLSMRNAGISQVH